MLSRQDPNHLVSHQLSDLASDVLGLFHRHGVSRDEAIMVLAVAWQRITAGELDPKGMTH